MYKTYLPALRQSKYCFAFSKTPRKIAPPMDIQSTRGTIPENSLETRCCGLLNYTTNKID